MSVIKYCLVGGCLLYFVFMTGVFLYGYPFVVYRRDDYGRHLAYVTLPNGSQTNDTDREVKASISPVDKTTTFTKNQTSALEECDFEANFNDVTVNNASEKCRIPVVPAKTSVIRDALVTPGNDSSIKFPLLSNYRSQCWYERLPDDLRTAYRSNVQVIAIPEFKKPLDRSYRVMRPLMSSRQRSGRPWRLRCLPKIIIAGVAKCGTTDMHGVLQRHPYIVSGALKEPWFYDWTFWRFKASLADYLDLFDEAAEEIRQNSISVSTASGQLGTYHPHVTIDASVAYVYRTLKPRDSNEKMHGPNVTVADMIRKVSPDAKTILMLRNPTERLFSAYLFYNKDTRKLSAKEFHTITQRATSSITDCLKERELRGCVYDGKVTATQKMVEVHAGIYYPFVKDWLKVFPDVKIIRLEDYKQNRADVIQDVVRFVGLEPLLNDSIINDEDVLNQGPKQKSLTMLPETREMLDNFYRPYNRMLAELLNDDKFLFQGS